MSHAVSTPPQSGLKEQIFGFELVRRLLCNSLQDKCSCTRGYRASCRVKVRRLASHSCRSALTAKSIRLLLDMRGRLRGREIQNVMGMGKRPEATAFHASRHSSRSIRSHHTLGMSLFDPNDPRFKKGASKGAQKPPSQPANKAPYSPAQVRFPGLFGPSV